MHLDTLIFIYVYVCIFLRVHMHVYIFINGLLARPRFLLGFEEDGRNKFLVL